MANQRKDEGGSTITRNLRVTEGLAAGLAITGAVLNALGSITGFYIWLVSNSLWVYVGHRRGMKGLMIQQAVFGVLAAVGIVCWRIRGIS